MPGSRALVLLAVAWALCVVVGVDVQCPRRGVPVGDES
jgi:hypothetical protein